MAGFLSTHSFLVMAVSLTNAAKAAGSLDTQTLQHEFKRIREEKRLQTEIFGLTWRPGFVDSTLLVRAIKDVPPSVRDAAYRRYQRDIRDTATPRQNVRLPPSGIVPSPANRPETLCMRCACRRLADSDRWSCREGGKASACRHQGRTFVHRATGRRPSTSV